MPASEVRNTPEEAESCTLFFKIGPDTPESFPVKGRCWEANTIMED